MGVPFVNLNNGKKMPIFGLGTWKSKSGQVTQAVKDAIDAGYRHFDCAYIYGNEPEVGEALKAKMAEGIKREDLFITSKLWNTYHRPDMVEPIVKTQLKDLRLDYLDLYLIHSPIAYKEGGPDFPYDNTGKMQFSDIDYLDTWKAMEGLVDKGLVKSIGVSNFNNKQLERILESSRIKPVNNQIESHPYLNQQKLVDYCKSKGIAVTAYSPLGSRDRPCARPGESELLDDPKLKVIAEKYNKTPAQVVLRYQVQRGNITIPKSVTKSRIEENMRIFDFVLSEEDIKEISGFERNWRVCQFSDDIDHKHYPFDL